MADDNIAFPLQSCKNVLNYDESYFSVEIQAEAKSQFDEFMHSLWNYAMECGFFRYKLDFVETKIIPGKYNFVAQLNVNRAVKRRMPEFINDIEKPFSPNSFNFTKVKNREVLFELRPLHWKLGTSLKTEECRQPLHLLIINVSPLELYNSLLVPDVYFCSPQIMTSDGLRLAVETMLLSQNQNLRIGFNSLGAFASVNHQHFHLYELKRRLYLEKSPVAFLAGPCYKMLDYPAEGFVFQLVDSDFTVTVVNNVMKLVNFLVRQKIAHNLFITRGLSFEKAVSVSHEETSLVTYDALRIFVWARQFFCGAKNDKAFNPALCELAGHFPIYNEEFYSSVTEENLNCVLRETCHSTFEKVEQWIKDGTFDGFS